MTTADTDVVAQVLQAERDWLESHLNCDVAALDRLMADEYTQISDSGRLVGKAEALASYGSGNRHWDEAHSDELRVQVYGEAAVVTGRWKARGVNAGEHFDYSARYVSVWINRDGRWQMVSDQSTEIS